MRAGARTIQPLVLAAVLSLAPSVRAGPLDTDESAPATPAGATPAGPPPVGSAAPAHAYTLAECLALMEKNHPNLWAARARLAYVHAQLDEAKWVPFWQWTANAGLSVLPPITGTSVYTSSSPTSRNVSLTDGLEPIVHFDISGVIPLYTFGKISSAKEAATAGVRVSEWDSRSRVSRRAWTCVGPSMGSSPRATPSTSPRRSSGSSTRPSRGSRRSWRGTTRPSRTSTSFASRCCERRSRRVPVRPCAGRPRRRARCAS